MRQDQTQLANGLRLIGEYNPESLSLAAGFFCRTGSRDETLAESGVSHFLEHMMFKGTERLSYDEINKTFDEIGARYNAFTSEENTVYYGQVLPEYQGRLVGLLAEMMRPALREADFDMEKKVIIEEIAMYADRPMWIAHDLCRSLHYGTHPLSQLVLGTTQSITDLRQAQMLDYFERRYAADNLTFVLSGKYDWDAAVAQIEAACGDWTPSQAGRDVAGPAAGGGVKTTRIDRFQQTNMILMAPGLAARDERRFAASVLAAVIGSGQASRLHWALVAPGLADRAQLGHDEEDGSGTFAGVLVCQPEASQQALDVYRGVLDEVQGEGIRADELQRATRRFASGVVLQAESPLGRLVNVGFNWVYRQEQLAMDDWLARLRAVTVDDCNALLAERPFDQLAVAAVGPIDELN